MTVNVAKLVRSKKEVRFLDDRRDRINLAREMLQDSFDAHFPAGVTSLLSAKLQRNQVHSTMILELSVMMANSLPDIALKITKNELLPEETLDDRHIGYQSIRKLLSHDKVIDAIDSLYNCHDSKYIRAFCNTIKHRQLIRIKTTLNSSGFYGPVLDAFTFDDTEFEEHKWTEVFSTIDRSYSRVLSVVAAVSDRVEEL